MRSDACRYIRRVLEEIYTGAGSMQSNSTPRDRLLGAASRGDAGSSARRPWISGSTSGRDSVPSINRNLYIIAEEHGASSVRPSLF